MPSDLIRGWVPVRVKKTRQNKNRNTALLRTFFLLIGLVARSNVGEDFMERGLKSAEAYRATASLCRQQAACDPDNRWRLLGEAERWEHLAEQILASRQKSRAAENARSAVKTGMTDV